LGLTAQILSPPDFIFWHMWFDRSLYWHNISDPELLYSHCYHFNFCPSVYPPHIFRKYIVDTSVLLKYSLANNVKYCASHKKHSLFFPFGGIQQIRGQEEVSRKSMLGHMTKGRYHVNIHNCPLEGGGGQNWSKFGPRSCW
jgi:hypothetical protein